MDETRTPGDPTPGTPDDDAAVARVRRADPAADAAPDAARLHALLADSTGVTIAGAAPDAATTPSGTDELAAARARRRAPARWLQVAAVAAGVALVGGGGYAVGATGGSTPSAPPIALQAVGGAGGGAATEMAAGDSVAGRKMMASGWFGGRTVFSGSGLEGAAGSSRAWAFDATSAATRQTAARVAGVLGVAGEPRMEWGQWIVGSNDGVSASVQVGVDGQANLWFYDRAWDPSVCTAPGTPQTLDGDGSTGSGAAGSVVEPGALEQLEQLEQTEPGVDALPAPALPGEPAPADPSVCDPASTPTGAAAVAAARDLMGRLGVDTDGYELTVSDDTGVPGLVSVVAAQVVDGTQTGVGWSVQLAGTGVQSVAGPLASLVELGTYDHISADEAVERLNDPRFGASSGGVMPLARAESAMVEDGIATEQLPTDEPTVPAVPSAGDPVAWPVQDVTITGARLGVTLLSTPSGASLLVPAWELTDSDGGTWSVVAVVEDQLDLTAA